MKIGNHVILRALLLSTVLLTGCVTQVQQARTTLATTARALVAVDAAMAPRYAAAAAEARNHASSWVEYDAAMAEWNQAEAAERATAHSLLAAEAGVDAWEHGSREAWLRAAPCLVKAADELLVALQSLNIHIEVFREAIAFLSPYVGTCEEGPVSHAE